MSHHSHHHGDTQKDTLNDGANPSSCSCGNCHEPDYPTYVTSSGALHLQDYPLPGNFVFPSQAKL
jgi:hypothetical protein